MADEQAGLKNKATAAGAAGTGTILASLFSLIDDGTTKSVLLIFAPALTILLAQLWEILGAVCRDKIADWKISKSKKKLQEIIDLHEDDPETVAEAKQALSALTSLEIATTSKKAHAELHVDA